MGVPSRASSRAQRYRMLRIVALFALVFGVVALRPVPVAADSGSSFAVGGGFETFPAGPQHFAFSAHQNGTEAPTGHAVIWQDLVTGGRFFAAGDVTCLTVVANHAIVGFQITKSNVIFAPVGSVAIFDATDNGEPVNGQPTDTMTDVIAGYASGTPCFPQGAETPIVSGNI